MIEKPASVRLATYKDEVALYEFLLEHHRALDNGWGHRYDPLLVSAKIEAATRPNPAMRSNPQNQERGLIGVIDGPDGQIIASIGLFVIPFFWFSRVPSLVETWLYVRPGARGKARHERALFQFRKWAHATLKAGMHDYNDPFLSLTGFMNLTPDATPTRMARLWRILCGDRLIGCLYGRE